MGKTNRNYKDDARSTHRRIAQYRAGDKRKRESTVQRRMEIAEQQRKRVAKCRLLQSRLKAIQTYVFHIEKNKAT